MATDTTPVFDNSHDLFQYMDSLPCNQQIAQYLKDNGFDPANPDAEYVVDVYDDFGNSYMDSVAQAFLLGMKLDQNIKIEQDPTIGMPPWIQLPPPPSTIPNPHSKLNSYQLTALQERLTRILIPPLSAYVMPNSKWQKNSPGTTWQNILWLSKSSPTPVLPETDPILAIDEKGFDVITGAAKVGDGKTVWSLLDVDPDIQPSPDMFLELKTYPETGLSSPHWMRVWFNDAYDANTFYDNYSTVVVGAKIYLTKVSGKLGTPGTDPAWECVYDNSPAAYTTLLAEKTAILTAEATALADKDAAYAAADAAETAYWAALGLVDAKTTEIDAQAVIVANLQAILDAAVTPEDILAAQMNLDDANALLVSLQDELAALEADVVLKERAMNTAYSLAYAKDTVYADVVAQEMAINKRLAKFDGTGVINILEFDPQLDTYTKNDIVMSLGWYFINIDNQNTPAGTDPFQSGWADIKQFFAFTLKETMQGADVYYAVTEYVSLGYGEGSAYEAFQAWPYMAPHLMMHNGSYRIVAWATSGPDYTVLGEYLVNVNFDNSMFIAPVALGEWTAPLDPAMLSTWYPYKVLVQDRSNSPKKSSAGVDVMLALNWKACNRTEAAEYFGETPGNAVINSYIAVGLAESVMIDYKYKLSVTIDGEIFELYNTEECVRVDIQNPKMYYSASPVLVKDSHGYDAQPVYTCQSNPPGDAVSAMVQLHGLDSGGRIQGRFASSNWWGWWYVIDTMLVDITNYGWVWAGLGVEWYNGHYVHGLWPAAVSGTYVASSIGYTHY